METQELDHGLEGELALDLEGELVQGLVRVWRGSWSGFAVGVGVRFGAGVGEGVDFVGASDAHGEVGCGGFGAIGGGDPEEIKGSVAVVESLDRRYVWCVGVIACGGIEEEGAVGADSGCVVIFDIGLAVVVDVGCLDFVVGTGAWRGVVADGCSGVGEEGIGIRIGCGESTAEVGGGYF